MSHRVSERTAGRGLPLLSALIVSALASAACVHWRASREYFGGPLGATPSSVKSVTGEWKTASAADLAPEMPGLMQSAESSETSFNLCFVDNPPFENGAIDVRFKAVAGRIDQGGGVVWRAKDGLNYYLCRCNPLESNLRVYKVVQGERVKLGSADLDLAAGWHHLRVEVDGEDIRCFLDEVRRLEIEDETLDEAGAVGLWTKADAQTIFADFLVLTRG